MTEYNSLSINSVPKLVDESNFITWKFQVKLQASAKIFHKTVNLWDVIDDKVQRRGTAVISATQQAVLTKAAQDIVDKEANQNAASAAPASDPQAPPLTAAQRHEAAAAALAEALTRVDLLKVTIQDISERRVLSDRDFKEVDNAAQAFIANCIDPNIIPHIEGKTTAKEIWKALLSVFDSDNPTSVYTLYHKINELKQKPDEPALAFTAKFTQLIRRLNSLSGSVMISDQLASHMLMSAADNRYESVFQSIRTNDTRTTLERVTQAMIDDDRRRGRNIPATSVAVITPMRGKQNGKHRKNRSSLTCYNCNKPGHIAAECRGPKKYTHSRKYDKRRRQQHNSHPHATRRKTDANQHKQQSASDSGEIEDDRDRPHFTRTAVASLVSHQVLLVNNGSRTTKFILDSGAAIHITGKRDLLHNYQTINTFGVQGFNSAQLPVIGKGDLHFTYYHNNVELLCKIEDVYHVDGV